ncbi:prepilin-type N-terminal cleavage/methylation domain-containing protein [Vibrio sp. 404]|uniref:Prepilin-type N-terminal cleavage/methylation domain-containing protein n=1 Tax=Vibrio marinisediminis TaxID=2758441 RepID=A0A7W2FPB0_9VIBR|nr:prepilin-type N-terminal cleavage/methylation domain-containing protein [Vibrio marinisediminis]MBA5761771.1 prepilin-type N-terminal cleavage/methylation domain-containing protein [Vibrio marinisediminis]
MVATRVHGFSLIENVIAITLAGFLMLAFSSLLAPTSVQTADALTQQRASQVATWLLQEMYSREFDEANIGNLERCGSEDIPCSTDLGFDKDELIRDDFDDYDTSGDVKSIADFGLDMSAPFRDFLVTITVRYVDDQFQVLPTGSKQTTPTKQVTLSIQQGASGQPLTFNAFRSNY